VGMLTATPLSSMVYMLSKDPARNVLNSKKISDALIRTRKTFETHEHFKSSRFNSRKKESQQNVHGK
jgi:hypothetical protein